MRRLSAVNSRIGAIEIERKNIAAQQTRLAGRRQVVPAEIDALEAQRQESQAKLDAALAHIAAQQAQLESKREEAGHLGKQIAQLTSTSARPRSTARGCCRGRSC